MQQDFGVARRVELTAKRREFIAKLAIVVNLAVEDDLHSTVLAGHRLPRTIRQIDDGQSTMGQIQSAVRIGKFAEGVRASVREGSRRFTRSVMVSPRYPNSPHIVDCAVKGLFENRWGLAHSAPACLSLDGRRLGRG